SPKEMLFVGFTDGGYRLMTMGTPEEEKNVYFIYMAFSGIIACDLIIAGSLILALSKHRSIFRRCAHDVSGNLLDLPAELMSSQVFAQWLASYMCQGGDFTTGNGMYAIPIAIGGGAGCWILTDCNDRHRRRVNL
ncbi:hypothetical protein C0991_007177, partial [Blastosporella zonata]